MGNNELPLGLDGSAEAPHALFAMKAPSDGVPQAPAVARILVIEDDVPLARLLSLSLKGQQYAIEMVHDGEAAEAALAAMQPNLVILDLNLPKIDGLTLLTRIRAARSALPIMVLTGRNRIEDLVSTLNQGADDCLLKPFSLMELQARIRALLRRFSAEPMPQELPPAKRGLTVNREEYCVERDGRRIDLTPREFAILEYMMQHPNRAISRATLMQEVWRMPFDPSTNIVDVYMKYLRDKIDCASETKLIRTVRGVGYALACA